MNHIIRIVFKCIFSNVRILHKFMAFLILSKYKYVDIDPQQDLGSVKDMSDIDKPSF